MGARHVRWGVEPAVGGIPPHPSVTEMTSCWTNGSASRDRRGGVGCGRDTPHPSVTGMLSSSTNQRVSRDLPLTDSCCYWLPMTSCFFPLGGYKSGDPNPELESADPETSGRNHEWASETSLFGVRWSVFWPRMRMRSSIGPWRNGSPYNVGVLLLTTKRVGLALLGAVLIFGWTPLSIDGVNAWACTNASSGLGCTNGAPSTTTTSWPPASCKGWGPPWPRCYKILALPIGIGCIFIWLPTAYATLMTVGVWLPGNGVVMKAVWHASWRIWAACSTPMKTSRWTTPSTCRSSTSVPVPTVAAWSANTCRVINRPPVWKSWKRRWLPSPRRTQISAVPEPLSPPGPKWNVTPSGDPSSEGCHSNWTQPWNSTRELGSVRDCVAPISCTSSPGPCPTTRWWWWTPIGPTRVSLMVAVPNTWGSCTKTAITMPWPACRVSSARDISVPFVTRPTIMPVNMPAPTIPPIVAVACRMGALITENPMPTTSPPPCPAHPVAAPSTAPPVWPTTWVRPTMANRPDPDAPPSARAAKNVRGVWNCYGGEKRGRNTAAGMPLSGLQGAHGDSEPPLLRASGTTPGWNRPSTLPRLLRQRKSTRGWTTHP